MCLIFDFRMAPVEFVLIPRVFRRVLRFISIGQKSNISKFQYDLIIIIIIIIIIVIFNQEAQLTNGGFQRGPGLIVIIRSELRGASISHTNPMSQPLRVSFYF